MQPRQVEKELQQVDQELQRLRQLQHLQQQQQIEQQIEQQLQRRQQQQKRKKQQQQKRQQQQQQNTTTTQVMSPQQIREKLQNEILNREFRLSPMQELTLLFNENIEQVKEPTRTKLIKKIFNELKKLMDPSDDLRFRIRAEIANACRAGYKKEMYNAVLLIIMAFKFTYPNHLRELRQSIEFFLKKDHPLHLLYVSIYPNKMPTTQVTQGSTPQPAVGPFTINEFINFMFADNIVKKINDSDFSLRDYTGPLQVTNNHSYVECMLEGLNLTQAEISSLLSGVELKTIEENRPADNPLKSCPESLFMRHQYAKGENVGKIMLAAKNAGHLQFSKVPHELIHYIGHYFIATEPYDQFPYKDTHPELQQPKPQEGLQKTSTTFITAQLQQITLTTTTATTSNNNDNEGVVKKKKLQTQPLTTTTTTTTTATNNDDYDSDYDSEYDEIEEVETQRQGMLKK